MPSQPVWLSLTFCQQTIDTKIIYMLKQVYCQSFKDGRNKWIKDKQNQNDPKVYNIPKMPISFKKL